RVRRGARRVLDACGGGVWAIDPLLRASVAVRDERFAVGWTRAMFRDPSGSLSASPGRSISTAAKFSCRCAEDNVPGIRRMFEADDYSGVNPPSRKNGEWAMPSRVRSSKRAPNLLRSRL